MGSHLTKGNLNNPLRVIIKNYSSSVSFMVKMNKNSRYVSLIEVTCIENRCYSFFLVLDTLFFPKLKEKSTRSDEKFDLKTTYT